MTHSDAGSMLDEISKLSTSALSSVATALRSGRLQPPYLPAAVARIVENPQRENASALLESFQRAGFNPGQAACLLDTVHAERERFRKGQVAIDLVTTGPGPSMTGRSTAVAVRELFASATQSVLLAGYAIRQGERVFSTLASRMDANKAIDARFFLEVKRPDGDRTPAALLISRFVEHFQATVWPGERFPEVYCDPRSVADDVPVCSSLHAKCVVVDGIRSFVSSANFTDAGQHRNIEIGVSINDSATARRLTEHFENLVGSGFVERIL